jgi:hypothetical protein
VSANSDILITKKEMGVVAISLFVMPVIYHHIQYPYRDLEKFMDRSHRFMMFGPILAGVTCNTILGFGDDFAFTVGRGSPLDWQQYRFCLFTYFSRR